MILTAIAMLLSVSCKREMPERIEGFSLDCEENILAGCEGGIETINVKSSEEWTAVSSEPWIMISPANGKGETKVDIAIDTTLIKSVRSAVVSFLVGTSLEKQIKVEQTGYANIIRLENPEVEIDYFKTRDERHFSSTVLSNVPFKASVRKGAEWLSIDSFDTKLDAGSRPRGSRLTMNWQINPSPQERVAEVVFEPEDETLVLEAPAVLLVTQKAAPMITDDRQGDSLAVVLINNILATMNRDDYTENMSTWDHVALWDALDKDLPCKEAVGRVRAVRFYMFTTDESVPQQISHLKYLQTLEFYSNVNNDYKTIALGSEICGLEHLEYLQIGAYGLNSLPDDFTRLGKSLVALDLSSNCFSDIPEILTPENFPKLKTLRMGANIRSALSDLRRVSELDYRGGIGMHFDATRSNSLRRILRWDNLEELSLSYNCIEGQIPDFTVGEDGVEAWSDDDVLAFGGDTIQFLATNHIPKILPKAKVLRLNLNFFTGSLPDWLLYHPYLLEMDPQTLIFYQREFGRNSNGELVQFDNEPVNFEYYFEAFPKFREKYTYNDVYED